MRRIQENTRRDRPGFIVCKRIYCHDVTPQASFRARGDVWNRPKDLESRHLWLAEDIGAEAVISLIL